MTRQSRLLDLLRQSPARQVMQAPNPLPGVVDEQEPFPFLAIVGHLEMKTALLCAIVNPLVGGVLLLGSRGTAKTTAVRSLVDLLPEVERSLCNSGRGCTDSLVDTAGLEEICPDCAQKVGYGEALSRWERVRIVELPLNARYEDVVGGIDERHALERQKVRLQRGILAQADQHILYIDEINLLDDAILDAILDAAAQGTFTLRRGPMKLTYWSRFLLVASMNPEEGALRPQIMDRFGLRVVVRGLAQAEDRFTAYERALWYRQNPAGLAAAYAEDTLAAAEEVRSARERLPSVGISDEARRMGTQLIQALKIDSNRADITLFEAARAYAVIDERDMVTAADIAAVAATALRMRRSAGLEAFYAAVDKEEAQVTAHLEPLTFPPAGDQPAPPQDQDSAETAGEA